MTIVKIITSILILLAGIAKVFGAKPLAEQFEEFGLPGFAMPLIGSLEIAISIGIQIHKLTFFASAALILIMIGAVASHIKVRHPLDKSLPAMMVLVLAVIITVGTL